MKITNFSPIIVSKVARALTDLFEELGFEYSNRNEPIKDQCKKEKQYEDKTLAAYSAACPVLFISRVQQ